MSSKKAILASCLVTGKVLPVVSKVRTWVRRDIPVLAYHRVWDITDENNFPFDVELVSASVADFDWQMEYVRENFNPITFRTWLRVLEGELDSPPRPLIVTFDDGFDDNYHHAYPILAALEIPATIFLSTGYIDTDRTYWYDRLAHLILRSPDRTFHVAGIAEPLTLDGDIASRRRTLGRLLAHLKLVPNEVRLSTLAHVGHELAGDLPEQSFAESRALNWNQIREMSAGGIEFGSHTVSHPILANLTDEELWHELTESKRTIEKQLGTPCDVISYPVGGTTAFNEKVKSLTEKAGYHLGVSYLPGTNHRSRFDRYALRRLHVERYTDRSYFAAMLNLPELFQ